MAQTNTSLTGGELAEPLRSEFLAIRHLIASEEDVHQVLSLAKIADESRWLYFIQTPFATWPKFVIGTTDPENQSPEILFRSGSEWSAREAWTEIAAQYETEELP